jgi:EAL and modified HD-GYP domain-containing signal transduction protein
MNLIVLPIKSIQHALVLLGTKEMTGWVQLMLFKGLRNAENEELIKISVVRGRMLSMIATEMKFEDKAFDCSMAGMLSSIDVILNQSMEKIVNGLALTQEVKDTLLGCDTPLKFCLDSIQAFETGNRNGLDHLIEKTGIPLEKLLSMYIEAIHWARTINY